MTKSTLGMSKPLLATSVASSIGTLPDLNLRCKLASKLLPYRAFQEWKQLAKDTAKLHGRKKLPHKRVEMMSPATFQAI